MLVGFRSFPILDWRQSSFLSPIGNNGKSSIAATIPLQNHKKVCWNPRQSLFMSRLARHTDHAHLRYKGLWFGPRKTVHGRKKIHVDTRTEYMYNVVRITTQSRDYRQNSSIDSCASQDHNHKPFMVHHCNYNFAIAPAQMPFSAESEIIPY